MLHEEPVSLASTIFTHTEYILFITDKDSHVIEVKERDFPVYAIELIAAAMTRELPVESSMR